MKKGLALLMALLLCAPLALADGAALYPACITVKDRVATLDMDAVLYEYQNIASYQDTLTFAATGLIVRAAVPGGFATRIDVSVYDVEANETLYERTYANQTGWTFTTKEIQTPYRGNEDVHLRVGLNIDGTYREVVVTRRLVYLTNNTVSAYGIRFRDLDASFAPVKITDKWYMFTPMDLYALNERGGTATLTLCASNMYPVGFVHVVRNGDMVYVQSYADLDVNLKNVRFTFFQNLSQVTGPMLENSAMQSAGHAMGTGISLSRDLGGYGRVLLYVSGLVDYDPNMKEKFYSSYDTTTDIQTMKQLLREIEADQQGNG